MEDDKEEDGETGRLGKEERLNDEETSQGQRKAYIYRIGYFVMPVVLKYVVFIIILGYNLLP